MTKRLIRAHILGAHNLGAHNLGAHNLGAYNLGAYNLKALILQAMSAVAMSLGIVAALSGCASQPPSRGEISAGPGGLDAPAQQIYRQALSDLDQGKSQAAAQSLEQLAQSNPHITEVWLNLALAFYHQNDRKRAEQTIDRILEEWPVTAPACNLAGLLALQAGKFDTAEHRFEQALQIDPDYVNALYNLALLKDIYLQDLPEAIHFYQQYLRHAKDDEATAQWLEELQLSVGQEASQ